VHPAGPVDHASDHDGAVEQLEQQVNLLLRRSRSVLRALAGRVHPGLDAGAYAVLLGIARTGPVRLVELADDFGLDKSTMSRQVSTLQRLGLVARRPDPADGRAFLLELSADGERRLADVVQARRAVWRASLGDWSTAEITGLAEGLARLIRDLPVPER
jgi:DNA-binding MarR family transcriptional regulator